MLPRTEYAQIFQGLYRNDNYRVGHFVDCCCYFFQGGQFTGSALVISFKVSEHYKHVKSLNRPLNPHIFSMSKLWRDFQLSKTDNLTFKLNSSSDWPCVLMWESRQGLNFSLKIYIFFLSTSIRFCTYKWVDHHECLQGQKFESVPCFPHLNNYLVSPLCRQTFLCLSVWLSSKDMHCACI